jgi:uncharacterized protein
MLMCRLPLTSGPVLMLSAVAFMPGPAVPAHAGLAGPADALGATAPLHGAPVRLAQDTAGQAAEDPRLRALFARAKAGDPVAQNRLGEKFENGDGVERDLAEAARWYRLAAE